jgi:quercetin dioxygenase-like cupin family protein
MLNSETPVRRQFVYDFHGMPKEATLGTLSSSQGASFNGERIYCGLVTKKRGTGSEPHYHPDETFNYVLEGTLKVNMDGREFLVPKGCLLHIPPDMVHTAVATEDADAVYPVWRDRSSEKLGKPVTIKA